MEIWKGTINLNNQTFTPYEGNQYAEIQDSQLDTSIFQNITPAAGGRYTVQFAHRGRTGTDTVNLVVTDLVTSTELLNEDYATGASAWDFYTSPTFLATGNQLEVKFTAIAPSPEGGQGNFLDAVSVSEVVPGPLPLLGAGAAFGFSRRMRRRINQSRRA